MAVYAPPLTNAPANYGDCLTTEAVTEGPALARSRMGTRWHRIRSSYLRLDHTGEVRQSWHFWCGQFGHQGRLLLADEASDGGPLCGTCEGRAIGYDRDHPEWIFTPLRLDRPERCPGSGTRFGEPGKGRDWRIATCYACGSQASTVNRRSYAHLDWELAPHEPGPGLPDGCEFHAWRQLVRVDGVTVCKCRVIRDDREEEQ